MNLLYYGPLEKRRQELRIFFFINLYFGFSFYLLFSTIIAPYALNKSRYLLSKDGFSSFLPTIRIQGFNDSFRGFTFSLKKNRQ